MYSLYGWIPTLTDDIFIQKFIAGSDGFEKCIFLPDQGNQYNFRIVKCKGIEYRIQIPKNILSYNAFKDATHTYVKKKNFSDEPKAKKESLIISIFDNENRSIQHLYIFHKINHNAPYTHVCHANVALETNGLVHCKVDINQIYSDSYSDSPWIKEEIARQAYISIRDIYHTHTYHDGGDYVLAPLLTDNREEAIQYIFEQFKRKIITYPNLIKDFVPGDSTHPGRVKVIRQAIGEYLYAKNFCSLFDKSNSEQRFRDAIKAITVLQKEDSAKHTAAATCLSIKQNAILIVIGGMALISGVLFNDKSLSHDILQNMSLKSSFGYIEFTLVYASLFLIYFPIVTGIFIFLWDKKKLTRKLVLWFTKVLTSVKRNTSPTTFPPLISTSLNIKKFNSIYIIFYGISALVGVSIAHLLSYLSIIHLLPKIIFFLLYINNNVYSLLNSLHLLI